MSQSARQLDLAKPQVCEDCKAERSPKGTDHKGQERDSGGRQVAALPQKYNEYTAYTSWFDAAADQDPFRLETDLWVASADFCSWALENVCVAQAVVNDACCQKGKNPPHLRVGLRYTLKLFVCATFLCYGTVSEKSAQCLAQCHVML